MRQCPFPVHSSDNRRSYRAGSVPGWALGLALIAALLGYAGFSHAEPVVGAGIRAAQTASHADAGRLGLPADFASRITASR